MTPSDDLFREVALDAQFDALAQNIDQRPITPTSRAYHGLAELYAPAAAQEAQAIERVRQRFAPHMLPMLLPMLVPMLLPMLLPWATPWAIALSMRWSRPPNPSLQRQRQDCQET